MIRAAATHRGARGVHLPAGAGPARSRALALWLWLTLAVAMSLAPALGRMHQVVHGPAAQGMGAVALPLAGPAHAARPEIDQAAVRHPPHAHPAGMLEALFAGHAGSDCTLLDHSLFGAALLSALLPGAAPAAAPAPRGVPATGIGARPPLTRLARAPPAGLAASA